MKNKLRKQLFYQIEIANDGLKRVKKSPDPAVLSNCASVIAAVIKKINENSASAENYVSAFSAANSALDELTAAVTNGAKSNKAAETAAKKIHLIKKELERENVTYEICFMPYKSHMWDCMDSVWRAAREDYACDVYVVPLPYMNLLNEKYENKYEGGNFPEYVKITHYDDYNLSDRMPDIIYIHNPFDDVNRLTRVDERFFCSELKKYTDMLVYIPYYFNTGGYSEMHLGIPAHDLYIDKIIVWNTASKKNLSETLRDKNKAVALGSPKVDRVLRCNEHKVFPDDWKEKIGGRKVIMFGISLVDFTRHQNEMFNKMEEVTDFFEKRDNIIMLYRPHPIMETNLKIFFPEKVSEYAGIKERIERIGIVDTITDACESAALCDAYIGTVSSVTNMFSAAGKPVLILGDYGKDTERDDFKKSFLFYWTAGGESTNFAAANPYNAIIKTDFKTGFEFDTEFIAEKGRLGSVTAISDEWLVILPFVKSQPVLYNIKTKERHEIKLNNLTDTHITGNSYIFGENVFFMPRSYNSIVKYNIVSEEISYFPLPQSIPETRLNKSIKVRLNPVTCRKGDSVFAAAALSNKVAEFNLRTEEYTVHTVSTNPHNVCWGICSDGTDFWLTPGHKGKNIMRWNPETGKSTEYDVTFAGLAEETVHHVSFGSIAFYGKYAAAIALMADKSVKIDTVTGEISEYKINFNQTYASELFFNNVFKQKFGFIKSDGNTVFLIEFFSRSIIEVELETGNVLNRLPLRFSDEVMERVHEYTEKETLSEIQSKIYYTENKAVTLNVFYRLVTEESLYNPEEVKKEFSQSVLNSDGTCGEKIHSYIMKCI